MLSVLLSSPSYMTRPQSLALSLVPVFPLQTTYCQPVLLPLCSDRICLPLTSSTLWYKTSTIWDAGSFHSPLTSILTSLLAYTTTLPRLGTVGSPHSKSSNGSHITLRRSQFTFLPLTFGPHLLRPASLFTSSYSPGLLAFPGTTAYPLV